MAFNQSHKYLEPLAGPPKRKVYCVYDIESKDGPTQNAGFTRPFMAGYFDGEEFTFFRDKTALKWKKRPCRWCKKKLQGYDPLRLCASDNPDAKDKQGCPKPCEIVGWEEFHLEARRGCLDRVLRLFLTKENNGKVLYAHNGGGFDHLFTLAWLTRHRHLGYEFVIIPVASVIQKIIITRILKDGTKLTWEFLDSMKLLPFGLDKAIKTFNVGKLDASGKAMGKVEMDLNTEENDPSWEKYLRVDCEALYRVLDKVHDIVENKLGGEVGITAPSTAMKLFRRRYLKEPIHRHPHFKDCKFPSTCDDCCHAWIRKGYCGGRTEIFEMQGEHLKYFDLNSSYAAAMKAPQPVGRRYEQRLGTDIEWRMRATHIGFAEATVSIPDDCEVPPLPYKADSGKLIFPVGEFQGIWDVDELKLLERPEVNGKILSVERVVWFEQEAVFAEMVDTLWAFRDKTLPDYDEGLSELAKLLINSTYGKFAMDPNKEEIVFAKPSKRSKTSEAALAPNAKPLWECFLCSSESEDRLCKDCKGSKAAGAADSEVWYKARHVSAPYIIPQIAAHITTIARIALWKYLVSAVSKHLVVVKDGDVEVLRKTVRSKKAADQEVIKWTKRGFAEAGQAPNDLRDALEFRSGLVA